MTKQFDEIQQLVLASYENGEFSHLTPDDVEDCGDGLLKFLLVELSKQEDCENFEVAVQRVESAMRQLNDLRVDLANATLNPASKHYVPVSGEEAKLDPLAGNPKLEVLTDLGYDIDGDSDQPGLWIWTAPTDGCEISYASAVEALDAAWMDAVGQTMGILNMSSEQWDALSFAQQKELIADTLSGD